MIGWKLHWTTSQLLNVKTLSEKTGMAPPRVYRKAVTILRSYGLVNNAHVGCLSNDLIKAFKELSYGDRVTTWHSVMKLARMFKGNDSEFISRVIFASWIRYMGNQCKIT